MSDVLLAPTVSHVAEASVPLCSVTHSGDITLHPSLPVTEDSPLAPPGIYGASKQLLEQLALGAARYLRLTNAFDSAKDRADLGL